MRVSPSPAFLPRLRRLAVALGALGLIAMTAPLAARPLAEEPDLLGTGQPATVVTPAPSTPPAAPPRPDPPVAPSNRPAPFGAKLFQGNFLGSHENGLNPEYVVMPGDRVAVYTWGAVEVNQVFIVDGQGNIFLPQIGPVPVAGVKNSQLTTVVKAAIARVFTRYVNVYTNLLNASPVAVLVTGAVARPGRYAGVPSDGVLFFLDLAGGIDQALGSYRNISVLRGDATIATVDLYDFLLAGKLPAVQFQDGDTILVGRRGPVVELTGNAATPALLELETSPASGQDALAVIPNTAQTTEVTLSGMREGRPFNATFTIDAFRKVPIHDGDTIELRADGKPGTILVRLEGEFEGPSVLSVPRGARLIDVLHHVPIDPALSDPASVHLRRSSVARAQKEAILDALARLERSAMLALSNSKGEAEIRVREAELVTRFTERARLIEPLGRVVTSDRGKQLNLMLEDGDIIVIPRRTNVVRIGGEVMVNQAVVHTSRADAGDYIERAGGYSERADEKKVIIIHASAEVEVTGPGADIQAGDEILVPPEVDFKELQISMDIMQVIYQVAMSAAVILAL